LWGDDIRIDLMSGALELMALIGCDPELISPFFYYYCYYYYQQLVRFGWCRWGAVNQHD
jgi:hypothetical protein